MREGGEGRQRAGPGQRPRPGPRDPAKCSCPRRRPSTQGEGQRSSHSRLQCFWAFLDQKFSSQREGHSRQQAPWSPRQALQARGMSPGTGSSWQVRGDNFQGVGRDWRRRDWLVSGGDRVLRGDRGLLFRPEGRGQRSRGERGPQPQETLHELELVRSGKTSTAVGFISYSSLSSNC